MVNRAVTMIDFVKERLLGISGTRLRRASLSQGGLGGAKREAEGSRGFGLKLSNQFGGKWPALLPAEH